MFDGKAFGQEIVGVVKEFVGKELGPILQRMEALEKRLDEMPPPRDSNDPDPEQIVSTVTVKLDADLSLIREAVDELNQRLPQDISARVAEEVQKAVAAIPAPQDGKSVTVEDVAPLITSEVEKRIKDLPTPKDGQDGKDGVGLAGAIIDRSGELIVTLTNGETRNLGPVVGKDGAPGKDGADGFGFDDLEASYDGEKTVTLKFVKGERAKEFAFTLPVVIDRGVYKEGQIYRPGDGVTWGGSYWICQEETSEKPDSGKGFRLAVKKGRDGRDGVMKEAKPNEPVRVGVPGKVV